ncbi:MAG: MFS transporter [Oscillospiraceae bacterium]|jgi:OFA family oxalate/formate antiporter-like MFS transporter|nr:MFS transporter [Oscillospiraceae bacterium]
MPVNKTERWLRLALGVVVLLFAGIIYSWSILKYPFGTEFGWDAGQLGLNATLTICFFCIGGFITGLMSKKTSPRVRLLISAVLLFAGFFGTSLLDGSSVALLYISYGVVAGIGIGFAYNTVISVTGAWFPDKKGLCSGVLMMGFGLTSLIIGKVADGMMRSETIGWRKTYLVLAIAIGAVLLVAALFIKPPREGTVFPTPKTAGKRAAESETVVRDYTATEMVRRKSFWLLFAFITLIAAVGCTAVSFVTDIIKEVGGGESFAVTAAGLLSIFNGLGRLVTGALFDALGRRKTQYVMSAFAIAAPTTVVVALVTSSLPLGIIGMALCFFSYGFAPTTSSAFASAFFGQKNFSLNFSIVNLILIPAPFAATLAGNLYKSSGNFISTFIILIGCSVVGLVVNLALKKP